MDFLNQATNQLRELMLSMTPAARVTALLLLGVIGVSMGYLVQHQSASSDSYLFNGEFMPASVIGRADAAIARAGLEGHEIVGNRIKVPSGRKSEFLAAVADGGALPPNFHGIMDKALATSPFASGDTRREKLKAAREQRLSMIIGKMPGIEEAYVIYDIVKARGLAGKGQATATVSVLPTPGESLDARRVKMIKKAVAGAIADLSPNQVVVTDSGNGSSFDGSDEITSDSFDDPYYRVRLAFEKKMKNDIENLLRDIPGARVQVTAELQATLERTIQTMSPEGDTVAIRENTQEESDKVSEIKNGGKPGLDAQGPSRTNANESAVTVKNERTKNATESQNIVGQKTEILREAGLIPQDIRVAIAVPTNYLVSVWRERERKKGNDPNEPLPKDIDTQLKNQVEDPVTDSIKNAVMQLLPGEIAESKLRDVEVVYFESLTPEPIEGPSTATQALGWASQNFNTMTMAVIALVGLMMLRSMVQSIPTAETAALGGPTLALDTVESSATQADGETEENGAGQRPRLRLKKGDSLKDDLIEIVREDPDAAAAILRSWIGNAGQIKRYDDTQNKHGPPATVAQSCDSCRDA